jgi:nucleoside-diphosphate-sugar epimerase
MNILVTGGLGLIGHNVVNNLQQQGHTVSLQILALPMVLFPKMKLII